MLCTKSSINVNNGSVAVYLNVYDLTRINGYAYWLGLGVYHSGVQGIFEGEPKQSEGFTFRKSILIGKTDMGPLEVRTVMEDLAEEYKGNAYNLITKNCNHFCNHASILLTGNPIPSWVNRLARIGFLCNCVLPVTFTSTKVRHYRIDNKPYEGDSKQLTNQANSLTTTTSNTCSSPAMRRGRSRTRRARPSSSPLIVGSSSS